MRVPVITKDRSKHSSSSLQYLEDVPANSTTWYGRVGEILFHHLYPGSTDTVLESGNRAPYDALHKDLGRVNVKTSGCRDTKHGLPAWSFQMSKARLTCDTVFLIGYSKDRSFVERAWLAPANKIPLLLKVMTPTSREYDCKLYEVSSDQVVLMDRKYQEILSRGEIKSLRKPKVRYERSLLGHVGESIYKKLYPDSDHIAGRNPTAKWDFTDSDNTKVNVRARRLSTDGRWNFFGSPGEEADVFFFIGLDRSSNSVEAFYRIPAKDMPDTGFSLRPGSQSKWDSYAWKGCSVPCSAKSFSELGSFDDLTLELASVDKMSTESLDNIEREALIDKALSYHRQLGFPYPDFLSDEDFKRQLEDVRAYQPSGKDLTSSRAGKDLCDPYQPHRYDTRNEKSDFSALGAFGDDDRFKKALRHCLDSDNPSFSRGSVRRSLTLLNRTPGNFRPTAAKALIDHYCPEGGIVLDPCAGWGGRLVGALVSGRSYFGVEPFSLTVQGLHRIGSRIVEAMDMERKRFRIFESPIQALPDGLVEADFAFTSPPYWGREQYDSAEEVPTLQDWKEDFLGPMFSKVWSNLKKGGVFAVNIVDLDKGKVPLEKMTCFEAEKAGFVLEGAWRLLKSSYSRLGSGRISEPVFIFRKE